MATEEDGKYKPKCPSYILNAAKNYYHRKKENDVTFIEKERERNTKYREENREKINEMARIRYRQRKELEKLKSGNNTKNLDNVNENVMNNETINTKDDNGIVPDSINSSPTAK